MKEQIKKMAIQAGMNYLQDKCWMAHNLDLERFAEFVRDDEREKLQKHYLVIVEQLRLDEREACAKLCENTNSNGDYVEGWFKTIATAIRARCN